MGLVAAAAPSAPGVTLTNNTHRLWWKDAGLRALMWHCFVLLLGSYTCGYDGSVMNGFFGLPVFLDDMGNPTASQQGLFTAAISLGYLIGFLPSAWLGDRFGRKLPQLAGSIIVVIGVFVQAFAYHGGWKFFGSRILIGFGAAFPLTLGSTHLFELAHPRQAFQMVTLFAAFYWVGAIVAAWSTFGCSFISSNWSWRIPSLLQGLASLIQAVSLYYVPESPRYLIAKGRSEEAHAILAKYHANGDMQDELVLSEMAEISTALQIERENTFTYADFLKTKANRHRLFIAIWVGLIVQWVGNGIISYYLFPILTSVGIESIVQQQGLNGGLQVWNLLVSMVAVMYCQKIPRRVMWLGSTVGCMVTYAMFTVCSAVYNRNGSPAAGRGAIAMIFLYSGVYDVAYSVFYYSYVLEILPYNMRAKGMALSLTFDYGALFFNQYVNPIGFTSLGYEYYYVYLGTIFISGVVIYYYFPETYGLTLEQSAILLDGQDAKTKVEEAGIAKALATTDVKPVKSNSTEA